MEISTYQCIDQDFGANPIFSRNFSAVLLGVGTATVLIDHSAEGADGYLINGMSLSSNKVGTWAIGVNGQMYITYGVFAPIFTPLCAVPFLYYLKADKMLINTNDTNVVCTIYYQFIMNGNKIGRKIEKRKQ